MEARLGIGPTIDLVATVSDFLTVGFSFAGCQSFRLLRTHGQKITDRGYELARPNALLPCFLVFQLSKSNKKARFLGRAA